MVSCWSCMLVYRLRRTVGAGADLQFRRIQSTGDAAVGSHYTFFQVDGYLPTVTVCKIGCQAIPLERSEKEGQILNLPSNTYHMVKIW